MVRCRCPSPGRRGFTEAGGNVMDGTSSASSSNSCGVGPNPLVSRRAGERTMVKWTENNSMHASLKADSIELNQTNRVESPERTHQMEKTTILDGRPMPLLVDGSFPPDTFPLMICSAGSHMICFGTSQYASRKTHYCWIIQDPFFLTLDLTANLRINYHPSPKK